MKVLRKIISSDNDFSNDMPRQMTDENIKAFQGIERGSQIDVSIYLGEFATFHANA